MIVKAYRTAKCITVDEFETDKIFINSEDPEEARECISNNWGLSINFTTKDDPYKWHIIPVEFVIEIKE